MASCRSILKKLVRDGRITQTEYDKLLRNLKPRSVGKYVIEELEDKHGWICKCSECGKIFVWFSEDKTLEFVKKEVRKYFIGSYCSYCGVSMNVDQLEVQEVAERREDADSD